MNVDAKARREFNVTFRDSDAWIMEQVRQIAAKSDAPVSRIIMKALRDFVRGGQREE